MTALVARTQQSAMDIAPQTWVMMKEQATMLVRSGLLPTSVKTPEAAMAIMMKGREMGVPPMRAFAQISIINGKPAVGAELMLSKIYERFPNAPIDIIENSEKAAVIRASRPGRQQKEFRFDLEDAKRADLLGKDSWRKYPQNMLYWRCVANMARAVFPECLHEAGASHTPEELGAEVNEDGDILDVTPAKPAPVPPPPQPVEAPAAPPPPAAEPRKAGVYSGEATQQEVVKGILAKRGVPNDRWEDVHNMLMGKPSTAINAVIAEVMAQ